MVLYPKEEETKQDEVCEVFFFSFCLSARRCFLKSIHRALEWGICTQADYSVLIEFQSKLRDGHYLPKS